jgi:putative protease
MPVAEDKRGTYILNAKDLCMIEFIPEVIQAGVRSLKIEGRMKGINYVATTVKVYREAIDAFYRDRGHFKVRKDWIDALAAVNRRGYCTGFYFGRPTGNDPEVESAVRPSGHIFVAKAIENSGSKLTLIDVRNKIHAGDAVDVFSRSHPTRTDEIIDILDDSGNSVPFAQPGNRVTVEMNAACFPNDLIRKSIPPDNNS